MPILVDYNQIFIANIMQSPGVHVTGTVEEKLIRDSVLNTLRSYRVKFSDEFDELIICCDDRKNWRRDVFKQYKASRRKSRDQSHLDWNSIYYVLDKIRDEIKDNLPYSVVKVDYAEADDVIAVLTEHYSSYKKPVLILSGDKDFSQLHKYERVKQYSPIRKEFIDVDDPLKYKREHIMKGDRGDGIPNFMSPDNTFTDGLRQKPLNKKKMASWVELEPEIFCDYEQLRNYKRNQSLVDFDYIPDNIKDNVLVEYQSNGDTGRSKIFNYFVQNRLKELMERIHDF